MNDEINEELLGEVKKTAPYVLAALLAVGAYYGVRNHIETRRAAASAALTGAYTVEELEEAVAKYGSTATGPALKIRLAKKYYDLSRYEEALELYDSLVGKTGDGFADIPVVGRAQTLEAQGKTDEAMQIYDSFAAENPSSYLALTARLGSVRCLAKTDKGAALAKIAELKDAVKDNAASLARVEALEDVITRL